MQNPIRPDSPARAGALADRLAGPALVTALALVAAGWVLPFMSVTTFFVFSGEFTILGAMSRLLEAGEWALFAILLVFTVLVPLAKMGLALWLWARGDPSSPGHGRVLRAIDALGRWSMLDVFLAAMLVVSIKLSTLSDVAVRPGLYVFAAGVALSIMAVARLSGGWRR